MKFYDIVAYKHVNGEWIQKTTVSEVNFKEMLNSPFILQIKTFTFEEWKLLELKAKVRQQPLGYLLELGAIG